MTSINPEFNGEQQKPMHFCAEISYETPEGNVHSDICFSCTEDIPMEDNYRKFIHKCLDEWLDKSNGTGAFWLAGGEYWDSIREETIENYLTVLLHNNREKK